MAADVIIHKATKVPVGKDQEQNLEMMRTFARRFNRMYKHDLFPIPSAFNFGQELVKVPGLDGSGKMGKSEGEGNAIFLSDEPSAIKKKIMKAKTDNGPTEKNQEKPEEIANLFTLMKLVSSPDTVAAFDADYNNCTIKYGDMKKQLAADMIAFTEPFREKIKAIKADEAYLSKVVKQGAEKARASASKTLEEARKIVGIKSF
jgi:tryptophanyl-tRNA synthetase